MLEVLLAAVELPQLPLLLLLKLHVHHSSVKCKRWGVGYLARQYIYALLGYTGTNPLQFSCSLVPCSAVTCLRYTGR